MYLVLIKISYCFRRQLVTDKNGCSITDEAIKIEGETTKYDFKKKLGVYKAKVSFVLC